ncbi:MAG TPA: hypothetical protein VGL13_04850 [Polyangiaceae bacterium]|jgi:hypothetical protein
MLVTPLAVGSCAEMYAQHPVEASIEFAESCAAGPYCVTGAVAGQNGMALYGVRCVAEWSEDEPTVVFSDHHGLFAMSGLRALPRQLRFEKDGFEMQPVSVVTVLRRRAAAARADASTASTPGVVASAGGKDGTQETSAEAGSQKLIGDDYSAADDIPDDELFDHGSGRTMRVLVTMRRLP